MCDVEKQGPAKVIKVGYRDVRSHFRCRPRSLDWKTVGRLDHSLKSHACTKGTETIPGVVMRDRPMAGTDEQVVSSGVDLVVGIRAALPKEVTAWVGEVEVFHL